MKQKIKTKTEYYRKPWITETMKLLESTKRDINSENLSSTRDRIQNRHYFSP